MPPEASSSNAAMPTRKFLMFIGWDFIAIPWSWLIGKSDNPNAMPVRHEVSSSRWTRQQYFERLGSSTWWWGVAVKSSEGQIVSWMIRERGTRRLVV
jgi:hypothetical protein